MPESGVAGISRSSSSAGWRVWIGGGGGGVSTGGALRSPEAGLLSDSSLYGGTPELLGVTGMGWICGMGSPRRRIWGCIGRGRSLINLTQVGIQHKIHCAKGAEQNR